jgi:hypothetical protein
MFSESFQMHQSTPFVRLPIAMTFCTQLAIKDDRLIYVAAVKFVLKRYWRLQNNLKLARAEQ